MVQLVSKLFTSPSDLLIRMTMRCIYPVRGVESLFVDRQFRAETPGIGHIKDPVKGKLICLITYDLEPVCLFVRVYLDHAFHFSVPPQMQKQTVMKPSFRGSVARKPADYARVGQWSEPLDKYAQWSLGVYFCIFNVYKSWQLMFLQYFNSSQNKLSL